ASAPASLARLRACCALEMLGDHRPLELIDAIAAAPASEGELILLALATSASESPADAAIIRARLNDLADKASDLNLTARYAIALLFLDDDAAGRRMLALGPDPTPWSTFSNVFAEWHGGLSKFPQFLARLGGPM